MQRKREGGREGKKQTQSATHQVSLYEVMIVVGREQEKEIFLAGESVEILLRGEDGEED